MQADRNDRPGRIFLGLLAAAALAACEASPAGLESESAIDFGQPALAMGAMRTASVQIANTGTRAVGPVELLPDLVRDDGGNVVPGSSIRVTPGTIPTLNPGTSATVAVAVAVDGSVGIGTYGAEVTARVAQEAEATMALSFEVEAAPSEEIEELLVSAPTSSTRRGDVLALLVEGRTAGGGTVSDLPVDWSVQPAGAAYVTGTGRVVAYVEGPITLLAEYGGHSASVGLIATSRARSGSVTKLGEASVSDRHTSDLWVHGDFAYTGTWGQRRVGSAVNPGNRLYAWDISAPSAPRRTHHLTVDARVVNDVKVRADGALGVLTHEGSDDLLNGVTFLDLSDPARPTPIGRFTDGLESGVHNAWLEGDYAYLVMDGNGNGLRILDVSDPAAPAVVATFYAGSSFLHDVYVRDGLAFLSHWNAGLVILDVGHGIRGGSPAGPVEVSRVPDLGGQTHNAWYWPDAGYVFVGEEDSQTPGIMRILDVRNLEDPHVVATFRVPDATPHNFWLDEDRGVLYAAWYAQGLRAIDVSGELLGELDRQGREIFGERYDGIGLGCASVDGTCAWAPQLHRGALYVSDMNNGMVVLAPSF